MIKTKKQQIAPNLSSSAGGGGGGGTYKIIFINLKLEFEQNKTTQQQ